VVKIEIEGKIMEQVSNFNYIGNLISSKEKDININLQKLKKVQKFLNP
jgi:hypothetical protein